MSSSDCLFITSSKAGAVQFSVYPYLGVGILSSFLKQRGLMAQLYDVDVDKGKTENILQRIRLEKPRMIGYSIMSISLPFFRKITPIIRTHFPEVLIVGGGPHVTNDPQIIADMGLDYGFRGQCEESFPEFVTRYKKGLTTFDDIPGIIIPGKLISEPARYDVKTTDISPDYGIYKLRSYRNVFYGRPWFSMITTDGCAYNCKFCKDPGKNRYAEYPLELIFWQLDYLVRQQGMRWISFVDDSFTHNRQRVIDICNYIIKEGLNFRWTCCTRADVMDKELLGIMKQAGLDFVILGVEAGNENVRKTINKNIPTADYVRVINEIRAAGVRCLCSYVLGNPGESYEQIRETIRLSRKLKANYAQYYNMTALPASPIFSLGQQEKVIASDAWTRYMRGQSGLPYYVPAGMHLGKLKRMRFGAFLSYYLRPVQFWDMGMKILKLMPGL